MPVCSSNVPVPEAAGIAAAAQLLAAGGIVVYPTETLYGLGADAFSPAALERLVGLKGREAGKAVSVLVATPAMLDTLVSEVSTAAAALMRRFWPGPLTLVFAARPDISPLLTGGTQSIGVRLSSHPQATALVRALGRPITAPSANPAGQPAPRSIATARAYFGARVDAYLDGGLLPGEPASTVVDARRDVCLLRLGAVGADDVHAAVASAAERVPHAGATGQGGLR
jgi:L-threonylcarbamoyladenylate synthase